MVPLALLPLAAASAPGLWQATQGIIQGGKANRVKLQDTRPQSFLEELQMRRLQANSQNMPGQQAAEGRIQQNFANGASAMAQSGTGASGVLSGLSRLNQNANQASNQLAGQAAAYQDQSRNQLVGALRQDAAYRTNDQNTFNREKAALKQASAQNIFGGLSTLGTVGAYAASGGFKKDETTGKAPYAVGQDTLAKYTTGGVFDPFQGLRDLGIGNWSRLHPGSNGRLF